MKRVEFVGYDGKRMFIPLQDIQVVHEGPETTSPGYGPRDAPTVIGVKGHENEFYLSTPYEEVKRIIGAASCDSHFS